MAPDAPQEAPAEFVDARTAIQHEEQAYDHGYHDGFEQRDRLSKEHGELKATEDYVRGFEAGYEGGFKRGVQFGVSLQVVIPRLPEGPPIDIGNSAMQ